MLVLFSARQHLRNLILGSEPNRSWRRAIRCRGRDVAQQLWGKTSRNLYENTNLQIRKVTEPLPYALVQAYGRQGPVLHTNHGSPTGAVIQAYANTGWRTTDR
jgi:hypothetical protein